MQSSPAMASPSSPIDSTPPPDPPSAVPLALPAPPSSRRLPPPCWSHDETIALIDAYRDKWYSLGRGNLKATHWQEVADAVTSRCPNASPPKTAIQCRHKMEKLRQRFRAEKHRLGASGGGGTRGWQYFGLMDELERGPLPISARPLVSLMPFCYEDEKEEDDDSDGNDGDDHDEGKNYIKSRSINYILSQRPTRKFVGVSEFSREQMAKRVWEEEEEEEEEKEEEGVMVNEMGLVSGLAAEMKTFAERFIGMENLKMEMMKETQRCRLEMENKRIEMIQESQQRIVDSIGRVFGSSKRMKMRQGI